MQRGGDTADEFVLSLSLSLHMSFTLALWAEGRAVCVCVKPLESLLGSGSYLKNF